MNHQNHQSYEGETDNEFITLLQQKLGSFLERFAEEDESAEEEPTSASEENTPIDERLLPLPLAELLSAENWTVRAMRNELPKAVGWDEHWQNGEHAEWQRMLQGLFRRKSPHVLIVGEEGIGKTTWMRELARQSVAGNISFLEEKMFLHVDCRYLLPEESAVVFQDLISSVVSYENVILCVNGLGSLLRGPKGTDQSDLLRTVLLRTNLQLIGELDPHSYQQYIGSRPEIRDCFTVIRTEAPDENIVEKILQFRAEEFQQRDEIAISEEVLQANQQLTSYYIFGAESPAVELKVLERACEKLRFRSFQQNKSERKNGSSSETHQNDEQKSLTEQDVKSVLAEMSGLPEEILSGAEVTQDFAELLGHRIFGQEEAVQAVANELSLIKAGLVEPGRPASVMLFSGLTGVGKTELARQIASLYSASGSLNVYSMGNFTEPHSVSGIIGVPPGYVGHEQGGRLVNELNADPCSVFLLDEAEKAHPNIWKPFLTLFDEGWIIDQLGRRAYADRAIFILTTNAGDRAISQMFSSGTSQEEITARVRQTLSRVRHERSSQPVFPAPFLARLHRILVFRPLSEEAMSRITSALLEKLQHRWQIRCDKRIEISEELRTALAKMASLRNHSAGGSEGGRILHRLIRDHIETVLQSHATSESETFQKSNIITLDVKEPLVLEGSEETSSSGNTSTIKFPEVTVTFRSLP